MNMTEIAKRAGVSQATVSRVLSGRGGVKKSKEEAVLKVARKAGFKFKPRRPRYKSDLVNIGLLYTGKDIKMTSAPLLIKYNTISSVLPKGCNAVMIPTGINLNEVEKRVSDGQISGLLVAGHSNPPPLRKFLDSFPHVWLNSHENWSSTAILSGNEEAGRIAADYLISKGCTKIGAIRVPSHNPGYEARIDGFLARTYNQDLDAKVFPCGNDDQFFEDIGWDELEVIIDRTFDSLAENISRCDGFFCPDDRVTAILYRILQKHNISFFNNIKVASCNNDRKCLAGLYPRPATIDFAPELTAKLAVEELMQILKGEGSRKKISIIVQPELVPGEDI